MRKLLIWTQPAAQFFSVCIPASICGAGEGSTKSTKQHFITLSTWSFWANMQSSLFTTYLANWTSHAPIPRQYNFSTASSDWIKFGCKSGEHFFPLEIGCRLLLHGGIRRGGAKRLAGRWKLCKVRIINWHLLPEGHYLLSIIHYQYIIGQEGSGKWKIWQWKDPLKLRVSAQTIW